MASSKRPKILLIKPVLPYPPNQGTKVATFSLIKSLADDFDITVLARILSLDELDDARELDKSCSRVVTVLAPNRQSATHRLVYKLFYYVKSLILRRPLKSFYECPGVFVREARRLSEEKFDLVVVEYWQLHRLLKLFPPSRTVLLTHDIDLLVNREVSLLERNLVRKIQAVRRWLLERNEEIQAYQTAKHIWALTPRDRDAVAKIQRENGAVEVLPLGIDLEFHSPPGMTRNRGEVLFMGFLAAAFNRDALDFFVRRVYPRIDELEGLSITVVGGTLPKGLEDFGLEPPVEVVGQVPDVRPYLYRASCLVVPLRFGGGLRIRILESMAAGLPVVCSSVAIAGMPFEAGKEFLQADTPEEFADRIRQILLDEALARSISQAAREKVRETYAYDEQRTRTKALVRRLIGAS